MASGGYNGVGTAEMVLTYKIHCVGQSKATIDTTEEERLTEGGIKLIHSFFYKNVLSPDLR